MTLKQLLSPAVLEWNMKHDHLPDDLLIKEFNKWVADNENVINESVKNNLEKINECIERGKEKSRTLRTSHVNLLTESADDDDDEKYVLNLDDLDFDNIDYSDEDKPISGDEEFGEDNEEKSILSERQILINSKKENDENDVFVAIDIILGYLESKNRQDKKNTTYWSNCDVSNVTDMSALFAFTDMRNANLSSWDVSSVLHMEGMFYKSNFNNDSICGWNVGSCFDFERMFTGSDFNQDISGWVPAWIKKTEYDNDGNPVRDANGNIKKIKVRADLPLIGAASDEKKEIVKNKIYKKLDALKTTDLDESMKNKNKAMKHILDFDTFINEGFGDYVKKGFNKLKSFLKNTVLKLNEYFVAMFDNNGEIIDASSPYTALNYIASGAVKGVTAFTNVKNEYLNGNVKSVASIVESPEYYGIIDKDSIEYRNYLTMVNMVNEHYSKYGNKLNENEEANQDKPSTRVGFTATDGKLKDCRDINSKTLKFILKQAILNVPAYKDEDFGGATLIWGAPGIGKTTIPKAIIKEWNENSDINDKKAVMVVECGNLTVDGFSLPIPMKKSMKQYMEEHPLVKSQLEEDGYDVSSEEFLNTKITVSGEATKTWLPCYKESSVDSENDIANAIANGHLDSKRVGGRRRVTETTEGGILLFDEFFRANESIFKILMQFILTRTFNDEYILGDKWAIIACSNRPADDDEVERGYESTGAVLGTRFGGGQYNFIPDFDDWKKWAVKYGHFDDATITFLMKEKDPSNGEYTNWHTIKPKEYTAGKSMWPTPRTWSQLMKNLKNVMENEGYSSVKDIPEDIIRLYGDGQIGVEMTNKYIDFLSKFTTNFKPSEVLDNPKYVIPKEMKCSEVIDRLKKYIDLTYDIENTPSDDQMTNMFNILEKTFDEFRDNYVRPFYASLFKKFGFHEDMEKFTKINFPKFTSLILKKYKNYIKSTKDLIQFAS